MLKKGSFLIFCFLFLINTGMVARCEGAVSSFDQLAQAVQSAQSGDIVYLEDTIVVSGSQSLTAPGIIITGKAGFDKASMLKISPESSLCLSGITLRGNGTEQTEGTTGLIEVETHASLILNGCHIENAAGNAIYGLFGKRVELLNSSISGGKSNAVNLNGNCLLTVDNGKLFRNTGTAIYLSNSCTLSVKECDIYENGAGIFCSGSTASVANSRIYNNYSDGILTDTTYTVSALSIENCNIYGNCGMAVRTNFNVDSTCTISGSRLNNNGSCGVYTYLNPPYGTCTVELTGCEIKNNQSTGIYNYEAVAMKVTDCEIASNMGGIRNSGTLQLKNSKIIENKGIYGLSGIAIDNNLTGKVFMTDTTVSNNISEGNAYGAVQNYGVFTMEGNSMISGNQNVEGVYISGGFDDYPNSGRFIMNGGIISGNAGGVTNRQGYFEMNAGTISANGSIGVENNGDFHFYGGTISQHELIGVSTGGALYMYDGAAIEYNHGSGVNVDNSAFFRMDGGQISNNTASSYGIVFINGGTFEMNGGAIYNNITQSAAVYIASCTSSSYGFKNGILRLAGESAFIDGAILIQPTAYIILTEPIVSSDKLYTLEVPEWFPSGNPIILPDDENVPDASVYLPHFPRSSNTIKNGYTYLKSFENIAAKIAGSFSGRILYADGTPAGGCTVEFIDADGRCVKTQLAGPDGSYASGDLFTGDYTVKAADQAGNTGSTAIEIKQIYSWESNTVLLGNGNITLKACSSVHGKVSDEQGNYIPNALVSLLTESGTVIFSTNSNEEGFYTISGIENGNYLLKAESPEGNTGVEELFAYHTAESLTCNITVKTSACISGVTVEQDGSPIIGASVLLRDENDLVIAKTTSQASGGFFFDRVPAGSYALSAEASVSYIDSFGHLKERYVSGVGQALVAPPYEDVSVGNILLKPEQAGTATISGKVTAHGEKQISNVIARDAYGNELCAYATLSNGKYEFTNVPDGVYTIIATTPSNGAGYTVITILDGSVMSGSPDITVYKAGSVQALEDKIYLLPDPDAPLPDILDKKEAIASAKGDYDSLSPKNKKQLSLDALDKLTKLLKLIGNSQFDIHAAGASVSGLELLLSQEELSAAVSLTIHLDIAATSPIPIPDQGPKTLSQYEQKKINDTAAQLTNVGYYEIQLSKDNGTSKQQISDIVKDTKTTGSITVTMALPEEARGYKDYYIIHAHDGKIQKLTDIDTEPNTVTFETDTFSTFALFHGEEEIQAGFSYIKDTYLEGNKGYLVLENITDRPLHAIAAVAAYQGGLLTEFITFPVSELPEGTVTGELPFEISIPGFDKVKIFLWDSLDNATPLEKAAELR